MRKIELLMLLLPIVFMIHEYEEIMMFRRWLDGNREELKRRFPKIEAFIARSGRADALKTAFSVLLQTLKLR